MDKGRLELPAIRAKLAIHEAKDDSDETLESILGNCVGCVWIIPAAKLLRDAGIALVVPNGAAREERRPAQRITAVNEIAHTRPGKRGVAALLRFGGNTK